MVSSPLTKDSDLSDTTRSIHIVTTASLPWMTGTAVNPLLRALYFQRTRTSLIANVTLVIPWIEREEERLELYGTKITFSNGRAGRKEQEQLIRDWAANSAGMEDESKTIRIQFYPSTYQKKLGSILTLVDICSLIPVDQADIAILEEPEHLNWLALPRYEKKKVNVYTDDFMPTSDIGWMQKFKHVVGIIHTNYPAYAKSYGVRGSRTLASKTILGLNILVCRSYCHKIVKLSGTLPVVAKYKECTCNVHGVRSDFLRSPSMEEERADEEKNEDDGNVKVYFIGKLIWAKGFDFLLHCQAKYHESTGEYFPIDVYGSGPDEENIKRAFHGVRRKHEKMKESLEEAEIDDQEDYSEKDSDEDQTVPNFMPQVYEEMLTSMPLLMEEINKDEETDHDNNSGAPDEKLSAIQTIRDGFKMMKKLPKEKFQFDLSSLPKTRHEWRKKAIPARFLGVKDHASLKFSSHKVFVNPSITEVLCTTSAEALAMGKFVILPVHPSNEFFYQFPNCLAYRDMDEFVSHLSHAMNHDPPLLPPELAHKFTWEAAMNRLNDAAAFTEDQYKALQASGKLMKDRRKAWIHQESGKLMKGDVLKSLIGGPPKEDLRNYEINDDDSDSCNESGLLSFENKNPKILALMSFIIAIVSYFIQR